MENQDTEYDKDKIREVLKNIEGVCVSCGDELQDEINVYNRGRSSAEDVWSNIDLMCDDCFENTNTSKSDRQNRKEIEKIIKELEDKYEDIGSEEFSMEFLREMIDK